VAVVVITCHKKIANAFSRQALSTFYHCHPHKSIKSSHDAYCSCCPGPGIYQGFPCWCHVETHSCVVHGTSNDECGSFNKGATSEPKNLFMDLCIDLSSFGQSSELNRKITSLPVVLVCFLGRLPFFGRRIVPGFCVFGDSSRYRSRCLDKVMKS
jgi:hypothetical protein